MTPVTAILLTGLGTYLLRAVFIVTASRRSLSPAVLSFLEYVGPAVMAALVVSMTAGSAGLSQMKTPELGGLCAAAVVARYSSGHLYSLIAGMTVFWLLRAFL